MPRDHQNTPEVLWVWSGNRSEIFGRQCAESVLHWVSDRQAAEAHWPMDQRCGVQTLGYLTSCTSQNSSTWRISFWDTAKSSTFGLGEWITRVASCADHTIRAGKRGAQVAFGKAIGVREGFSDRARCCKQHVRAWPSRRPLRLQCGWRWVPLRPDPRAVFECCHSWAVSGIQAWGFEMRMF